MRRLATALLLVAAIAAQGCGTLLEDSMWGDNYSHLFKGRPAKTPPPAAEVPLPGYPSQPPLPATSPR